MNVVVRRVGCAIVQVKTADGWLGVINFECPNCAGGVPGKISERDSHFGSSLGYIGQVQAGIKRSVAERAIGCCDRRLCNIVAAIRGQLNSKVLGAGCVLIG